MSKFFLYRILSIVVLISILAGVQYPLILVPIAWSLSLILLKLVYGNEFLFIYTPLIHDVNNTQRTLCSPEVHLALFASCIEKRYVKQQRHFFYDCIHHHSFL